MPPSPLRIGIVGAGNIARVHMKAWQSSQGSRVVGVADVEPDKAASFAGQWDRDLAVADSLDALLDRTEVDLIDVCTLETAHAAVARPALDAGRHVLSEKILAHNLEEGHALASAAARHPDLFAGVQYNYRFFPQIRMLFHLVRTQSHGPLRMIHINAATQCFNHLLDSLLALGGEPLRVSGMGPTDSTRQQGVDPAIAYQPGPVFAARIEFPSGLIAGMNAITEPEPPFKVMPFQITAMFEQGVLEVSSLSWPNHMIGACRWLPDGPNLMRDADLPGADNQVLSFNPALDSVARAALGETPSPPPATFADGWRNMLVSHGLVLSSAENQTIDFPALRDRIETSPKGPPA